MKIGVFGSLNMDMVMSMDHFPSPGETKTISSIFYTPGGKGANQAVAAVRAGMSVSLWGAVGRDPFGDHILDIFTQEKSLDTRGVKRTSAPTGTACVWVNGAGENCIVLSSGANDCAEASCVPEGALTSETVLLLQMEVPAEENWSLVKRASAKGARVLLNLAPVGLIPEEILPLLHGVIVNEGEAHQWAQQLDLCHESLALFGQQIAKTYGPWVSITRGAQEAFLCTSEEIWRASPLAINPLDTTAAGDTFVGFLGASLAMDFPLPKALHHAMVAGSLACLKKGAIPSIPYFTDVLSEISQIQTPRKVA